MRNSGKAYSLGPVLAALGSAVHPRQEGVLEAREEIRQIAKNFDVPCLVAVAVNDEMIPVDRVVPQGVSEAFSFPSRAPIVPPAGLVYTAWLEPAAFDAWLKRHGRTDTSEISRYRQAAAVIRERGFAGGFENSQEQLIAIVDQMSDIADESERVRLARELVDVLRHGLDFISAPIFAPDGSVEVAIAALLPSESIASDRTEAVTNALLVACERVSTAIGGRRPRSK
jgi:DNA-binding IclR family transcriptional regulator